MMLPFLTSLNFGGFRLLVRSIFLFNTFMTVTVSATQHIPESYDFIIVGAGSTGSVIAHRLSEHPKNFKVLLLEAGGGEPFLGKIPLYTSILQLTNVNWEFVTEPQKNACLGMKEQRSRCPAGRMLGGSSVLSDMVYVRGNRRDYDHWEALGNFGWRWKEVLPYFLKSEDNMSPNMADNGYHGKGGLLTVTEIPYRTRLLQAFLDAVTSLGYTERDINGEFQSGVMPIQATMRRGSRCSTNKAFISTANKRNLEIKTKSRVIKVLFDGNKRATGVVYHHSGKEYIVNASKEVILSAGAINTPHLLMLSGIGAKDDLEKFGIKSIVNLPGVGSNMQDHVMATGLTFTIKSDSVTLLTMALPTNILNWALFGKGPLTIPSGCESIAFLKTHFTNQSDDWPDMQMVFAALSPVADYGLMSRKIIPYSDESWNKYYGPYNGRQTFSVFPTVIRPKSRGFVKLRSKDPYDHPIIDPQYLSHKDDLDVMIEGIKMGLSIGNANSFKKFDAKLLQTTCAGCEEFKLHSEDYWKCLAIHMTSSSFHHVGTAKMGVPHDTTSVLDYELNVYGVAGLRVADCSIMPTIVSGNTLAAAIMIGEKASDMIIKKYQTHD